MGFDKETRNMLAGTVERCRRKLIEDIGGQLQSVFGIRPDGTALNLDSLAHLTPDQLETSRSLRELLGHYTAAASGNEKERRQAAYERIVMEISFTVLNRLVALRLCEERGLVLECVRKGTASDGFLLFERLSEGALGDRYDTYRRFLECLYDEASMDLGILFDRFSPLSAVFPTERCLEEILDELNQPKLAALWMEDETIGWIYQYFNPQEERRAMRKASQTPRNSRELAVRNQFFTPRYVVEFLTDNTLGRTWYEMRQGETALIEKCRYLVRRPDEVILSKAGSPEIENAQKWLTGTEVAEPQLEELAHTVNAYPRAGTPGEGVQEWLDERLHLLSSAEKAESLSTQELLDMLFLFCRRGRFCDGVVEKYKTQINCILQELRSRIKKMGDEDLSQEELLKLPVFIPHRAKKDPRDIKILDPACGSGHFLLYAFDLLEQIYREAWEDPLSPVSEATGHTLRDDYETFDELNRVVPELIIRWNLYGIDIDYRAVQIAALALWLRAQKSWQQMGLKASGRPRIVKSNIVTAEPMPGDREMLQEFTSALKPRVLGQIVETVFEKMKLAGEAGSLLKIEDEISEALAEAKKQWLEGPLQEQQQLLLAKPKPKQETIRFDVQEISHEAFWEQAEERILLELKKYAEGRENGNSTKRRLFVDDADRGFAFIDISRMRYDLVLMNPPYGDFSINTLAYAKKNYKGLSGNIYSAFWIRALELSSFAVGALTSRTFMNLGQFRLLREHLLSSSQTLKIVVDLGASVLDNATVDTAATIVEKGCRNGRHNILFYKVDSCQENRGEILEDAISNDYVSSLLYICQLDQFKRIPSLRLLYWAPNKIKNLFNKKDRFEPSLGFVRPGLCTGNDFRFTRFWWEIENVNCDNKWVGFAKGGDYERYYSDLPFKIKWSGKGKEIKEHAVVRVGSVTKWIFNEKHYFNAGITFPNSGLGFSARILPPGFIISVKGQGIYTNDINDCYLILAILNSRLSHAIFKLINPGKDVQAGDVKMAPFGKPVRSKDVNIKKLNKIIATIIDMSRYLHSMDETSNIFTFSEWFLVLGIPDLEHYASEITKLEREGELLLSQAYELPLYDVNEFVQTIEEQPSASKMFKHSLHNIFNDVGYTKNILSLLVGIVNGRWDVRIALNHSLAPDLPKVYECLPICPPGMLINHDGHPTESGQIVSEEWLRARPDAGTLPPEGSVKNPTIPDDEYPIRIPWDGILVDDPGFNGGAPHRNDIIRRVREVLDLLWGDRAQVIEDEACEILGLSNLREYFRKPTGFFQDHLKQYSKSRRKAPIYLPLSTASGSYTVWLYYHRLNDQTLYAVVNKYIDPKIADVEQALSRLDTEISEGTKGGTANLRDRLSEGRTFLGELRELREELLRVASLPYKPNLNDGVIITAAPLHKLFRLRSWAKDTKNCWEKLEQGDYDWAHLAYTLWPERVEEVCRRDRSIAIAHGLEEICEIEPPGSKRNKRGGRQGGTSR